MVKLLRIARIIYGTLITISYLPPCSGMSMLAKKIIQRQSEERQRKHEQDLVLAAQGDHQDTVKRLVTDHKTDVNVALPVIMDDGRSLTTTPLAQAAQQGCFAIVKFLLKKKANPNYARSDGVTPLILACENGHKSIATLLVTHKANPNQSDTLWATPLLAACRHGHYDTVEFLLQIKANPHQADQDGITPLAKSAGQPSIIKLLSDTIKNAKKEETKTE